MILDYFAWVIIVVFATCFGVGWVMILLNNIFARALFSGLALFIALVWAVNRILL